MGRKKDRKRRGTLDNSSDAVGYRVLPVQKAVDWFVENTADREPNLTTLLRWERWCSNRMNCAEYVNIVEMSRQVLPLLPPPGRPSQGALLEDAASDQGNLKSVMLPELSAARTDDKPNAFSRSRAQSTT
jgi:hypothetical protein